MSQYYLTVYLDTGDLVIRRKQSHAIWAECEFTMNPKNLSVADWKKVAEFYAIGCDFVWASKPKWEETTEADGEFRVLTVDLE